MSILPRPILPWSTEGSICGYLWITFFYWILIFWDQTVFLLICFLGGYFFPFPISHFIDPARTVENFTFLDFLLTPPGRHTMSYIQIFIDSARATENFTYLDFLLIPPGLHKMLHKLPKGPGIIGFVKLPSKFLNAFRNY